MLAVAGIVCRSPKFEAIKQQKYYYFGDRRWTQRKIVASSWFMNLFEALKTQRKRDGVPNVKQFYFSSRKCMMTIVQRQTTNHEPKIGEKKESNSMEIDGTGTKRKTQLFFDAENSIWKRETTTMSSCVRNDLLFLINCPIKYTKRRWFGM